jgi:hypothetical protein
MSQLRLEVNEDLERSHALIQTASERTVACVEHKHLWTSAKHCILAIAYLYFDIAYLAYCSA